MATNGNNPQIEQAEAAMRQFVAGKHPNQQPAVPAAGNGGAGPREGGDEEATYDLAMRMDDAVKAIRDLADYSNNVAGDIERITAKYIANTNRLLGKIGK